MTCKVASGQRAPAAASRPGGARVTPEQIAWAKDSHVESPSTRGNPSVCGSCGEWWPCSVIEALAELAAAVAERDRLRAALEGVTQFLDEEEMFFDSGVSVDRLEALLDRARAALAGSTGGGGGGE
jgi:hypothetical protein